MDSATEDLYFQKLQELVHDEDKIVTVSSFASDLGISVQNSRNLIKKYIEDQRQLKSNELTITYILSGTLCNDRGRGILMVKEEDLETNRKLFETKPYEIIYSVQKSNNVDLNIIALVDMFSSTKIREKALKGSVVSKNCIKRRIKLKKLPSPPPPTIKGKSSFFMPKPGKSAEENKSVEKPAVSPKNEQKGKAGGIAGMFKAAAAKSNQKDAQNASKLGKTKSSTHKQVGGLAGFLTSSSQNSSKTAGNGDMKGERSERSGSDSDKVESQNSTKDESSKDMDVEEEDIVLIKTETVVVEKDNVLKKKQEKKNKRRRDKSQEMPSKKRKRIIERNDSDSDDMFEKEDDIDIIEKSDEEPERVPSPVVQKQLAPKNKRRKAVSKTYEDEEGFIVTKTEYVYETASEDENTEPEPKPRQERKEEKVVKTKVNDKKKPAKNQATLMNFFKKV